MTRKVGFGEERWLQRWFDVEGVGSEKGFEVNGRRRRTTTLGQKPRRYWVKPSNDDGTGSNLCCDSIKRTVMCTCENSKDILIVIVHLDNDQFTLTCH